MSKAIFSGFQARESDSLNSAGSPPSSDSNQIMMQALKNSTVDLSAFSRQISQVSRTLKGDKEALEGLRNFVKEFGQSSDKTQAVSQITALQKTETTDKGTLKSVFQTAEDLGKIGGSVSQFVGTVSGISSSENRQAFIGQVQDVATDTESSVLDRRTTLKDINNTANAAIKQAGKDEKQQNSNLSELFTGLAQADTLQDKGNFLKEFRSDLQNTA